MKSLTLKSPAKLNLTLQILNKREDGYHNLKSEFQTVNLCDEIILTKIPEGIQLIASGKYKIPNNRDNLAYQVAEKLRVRAKGKVGVRIEIEKNIPLFAGLGGGSSNAATVLKGLIDLWDLDLSIEKQVEIAKSIGADVPFFLYGGHCLVEGIGKKVTPLENVLDNKWIVIAQLPYIRISTPWAYNQFDKLQITKSIHDSELVSLNKGDTEGLKPQKEQEPPNPLIKGEYNCNDFEKVIFNHFPDLLNLKNIYLNQSAEKASLTGSGSAVYGIFNNQKNAQNSLSILQSKCEFIGLFKTV